MPPPLKVEHCQGEMDELSGHYLNKLSYMANDSHTERRTEDSTHPQESPTREDGSRTEKTNGNVDLDVRTSLSEEKLNMLQEMSLQEEGELKDENYDSVNSPTVSGRMDAAPSHPYLPGNNALNSATPLRVREKSVSPERASKRHKSYSGDGTLSLQEDIHKVSNPPSSPRHRESMTLERSCQYRPEESSSPKRSDQNTYLPRSRTKDGSSQIRRSASPKSHDSPRKYGRLRKSASRSPVRQRDTSSRYKRDRSHRSRSRSPYKRDRGIYSRGRHSPRRRSSPTYHLSRHSPRSKPWAPPPNRRTGLGKPGNILFVAGFNFLTTEGDLKWKFSRFGRVRDVRIVRDKRSGDSRGFGFISLERDEDADAAIKALDETEWNGRIILVEKSKSH